ncbi:MAG: TonB-dependent receptor [Bacteroidota bacterium]
MISHKIYSQDCTIKGKIIDVDNREPQAFANIVIQGTNTGATTDIEGNYIISNLKPGIYTIIVNMVGYENQTIPEVSVNNIKPTVLNIELKSSSVNLSEVEVNFNRFEKSDDSPLSKFTIRSTEIMRNPGGNRDISKVIQSLPGVASTASFRNDIIIRGGAPNENRFFLDGIEVPNINHFATQGSSGGPVGLINVNFINQVEFYSGAFPAARGNSLSSVLEFKQKNGNPDRFATTFMLGSSDVGLTFDGPIGKKADFIFSLRRSYLQFIFSALKLPFLPTYNDAQYKVNVYLNEKNTLTFIGLGAVDQFSLNTSVNDGITDSSILERNKYILGYLPVNEQWNYTFGVKYTHYAKNGFQNIIFSRNMLNNTTFKYFNNDESSPENKILDYKSREQENKFRFENNWRKSGWKIGYGVNYEYAIYTNETYNRLFVPGGIIKVDFNSRLDMNKYGGYFQVSRQLANNRLTLSLGTRMDGNDFSAEMNNPLQQFSPRLSASYKLTEKWFLNFNTGRYFQLPAYTVLGYRDSLNQLANKNNGVKYIQSDHAVFGVEHLPEQNTKISVESFYKQYSNYPMLIKEGISLANLGSDFGVIGNAPVNSTSKGRSYGLEVLIQRTIKKGFYGILAYTFVRSEFANAVGDYAPSSWDNNNILTITAGKQFKRNWEVGFKFRYFGGAPYTPYDLNSSSLRNVWDITGQGVFDYSRINSNRLPASHQLDIRIDKKIYIKKTALNIYLDIQNLYNRKIILPSSVTVVRDQSGNPIVNPADPNRYILKEIKNESGTVLPAIGIMFEF